MIQSLMDSKTEILDFLHSHKLYLKENYHITKIGLFGSFARDETSKNSDVDILIEIDDKIKNIHDTKNSLKEFLSQALDRSVDLAREKYLKPYAKEEILKDILYV